MATQRVEAAVDNALRLQERKGHDYGVGVQLGPPGSETPYVQWDRGSTDSSGEGSEGVLLLVEVRLTDERPLSSESLRRRGFALLDFDLPAPGLFQWTSTQPGTNGCYRGARSDEQVRDVLVELLMELEPTADTVLNVYPE